MAITAMALIAAGMAAQIAGVPARGIYTVAVCIESFPLRELNQAELIAGQIFRTAGVVLEWHRDLGPRVCPQGAVRISVLRKTEAHRLPGALACAVPGKGALIQVFYDRIEGIQLLKSSALLAHVLVHEITHVLQGFGWHSQTGVMKARWDALDYDKMAWKWLPFTTTDIEL